MAAPDRKQRDYWNSLAKLDPDAAIIDPNDLRGFKNAYLASIRDQALEDALERHGVTCGRLLDLGCGSGSSTISLLRRGHSVLGVDISRDLLGHAINRCRAQNCLFVLTDGQHLPLSAGSLDAAVTYVVLSYVVDNAHVLHTLKQTRDALKPGAPFLMIEQVRRHRRSTEGGLKVHRTVDEWQRLLADAGFTLERHSILRHGRFPGTLAIQSGLLPRSLWNASRRAEEWIASHTGVFAWDYAEVCFEVTA